jgi:hypothetical protein
VLDWQLAHGAPLAGKELENTIRVDTHCDIDDAALFERLPARRG